MATDTQTRQSAQEIREMRESFERNNPHSQGDIHPENTKESKRSEGWIIFDEIATNLLD